jgi:hypothetical protein
MRFWRMLHTALLRLQIPPHQYQRRFPRTTTTREPGGTALGMIETGEHSSHPVQSGYSSWDLAQEWLLWGKDLLLDFALENAVIKHHRTSPSFHASPQDSRTSSD